MAETSPALRHKRTNRFQFFLWVLYFALTGYFAVRCVRAMRTAGKGMPVWGAVAIFLLLWSVAFYGQVILHEAGHLLFGWMAGYRFLSFRVGKLCLTLTDAGLRWSWHSVAGIDGQCLMAPQEKPRPPRAQKLYNYGGALMNIFLASIAFVGWRSNIGGVFFSTLCMLNFFLGLFLALLNGIPMQTEWMQNDGYHARLVDNPNSSYAFWLILEVATRQNRGQGLGDMEASLFRLGAEEAGDSLCAEAVAMRAQRALLLGNSDEAASLYDGLLTEAHERVMTLPQRDQYRADRYMIALLGNAPSAQESEEAIRKRYAASLESRAMKLANLLRKTRTAFVLSLAKKESSAKVRNHLLQFEQCAATWSNAGEAADEKQFVALLKEKVGL